MSKWDRLGPAQVIGITLVLALTVGLTIVLAIDVFSGRDDAQAIESSGAGSYVATKSFLLLLLVIVEAIGVLVLLDFWRKKTRKRRLRG
jgi:hypothetical protein